MLEILTDHPATHGLNFYEEQLKPLLEPQHNGEYVAIDPAAKLYAVAKTPIDAHDALRAQGSTGWQLLLQVGSPHTFEMFVLE